jgi:hypothetical protein
LSNDINMSKCEKREELGDWRMSGWKIISSSQRLSPLSSGVGGDGEPGAKSLNNSHRTQERMKAQRSLGMSFCISFYL